jgi:hypothetical protein
LRIAIFVDGPSDRDTLKILARKLLAQRRPTPGLEFRVLPRGDFFSSPKISAYLTHLHRTRPDVDKAILCLDCDCTPAEDIQPQLTKVQEEVRRSHPSLNPTIVLKVHALEGWLASDRQAVQKVLGAKPKTYGKPENVCNPKELLAMVFKKANKDFDYMRDDPRLAQETDIERLCRSSPSFSEFRKAIEDP